MTQKNRKVVQLSPPLKPQIIKVQEPTVANNQQPLFYFSYRLIMANKLCLLRLYADLFFPVASTTCEP